MGWIRWQPFWTGVALGPALSLGVYLALIVATDLVVGDGTLILLGVWPAVAALVVALVVPAHRATWGSVALGLAVGVVVAVALVVGLISGVAFLLSDPSDGPA